MDGASWPLWPSVGTSWWLRAWGGVAVLGGLASPLVIGVAPAVVALTVGWAMGLVALGILAPSYTAMHRSRCFAYAGLCGAAFATQLAAIQVLGPAALWLAILAAATSSWAVRRMRAVLVKLGVVPARPALEPRTRQAGPAPAAHRQHLGLVCPIHLYVPMGATAEWASDLDTARLCHAWRRSFLALGVARSSGEVLEVTGVRRLLLDELHDRHPDEVRDWIAAGGRAASGPERFLHDREKRD